MKRIKRFIRALALVLLVLLPFWAFSNYAVKVARCTVTSPKINEKVTAVLVSDLHGDSFGIKNSGLIKLIGEQHPDVVFVLGDMYSRHGESRSDVAINFCAALTGIAPVYFVSGDHDYDDSYFNALELNGVEVLNFEKSEITLNGNEFCIYGIRSEWFSPTFDLNNAFDPADKSKVNVLLAHCPYLEKYESFSPDFVFSGDTHGGLMRLPVLGPLYYNGSVLPKYSYSGEMYDKGYFEARGTKLFVTSGVGNYPLPARLNNRPEIAVITFEKGE